MKKKIILANILSSTLLLSSCTLIGTFMKDESIYGSIISESYHTVPTTPSTKEYTNTSPLHLKYEKDEDFSVGLPASGDVKTLVIPIQIGDDKFTEQELKDIEKAFNGTSEETGYESVHSYYDKASNGKLNLTADITPVYKTEKSKLYYDTLYFSGVDIEFDIIKNALTLLNPTYNFDNYDYNKDSYIDAVYLIYSCDYDLYNDNAWWAWCYEYYTDEIELYDHVEADFYVWASVDFLKDENGNGEKINVNAETIIHETGHLFGLDDYYDYNEYIGPETGTGGGMMMDSNVGDHDPFSKIMLGWSTPTIIENNGHYEIKPSVESNECLLLPLRSYNDNIFNEYLLIDYYTPTSLNRFHKGTFGLFSEPGIRILHIDARIDSNLGKPKNDELGAYFTIFSFNNTDTEHSIMRLIEGDKNSSVDNVSYSDNDDLFKSGQALFGVTNHDDVEITFILQISEITSESASIILTNYNI